MLNKLIIQLAVIVGVVALTLLSRSVRSETLFNDFGRTAINGHVTVGGYLTTRNTFETEDSTEYTDMNEAGLNIYHTFNQNFSISFNSTTNRFVDYGFLQGRIFLDDDFTTGLRVGRINIQSGLFGGYGPYSDGMNWPPQGTEPSRVGQAFYRFDGIQWFNEFSLGQSSGMVVEFSYGEHVVTSEKGAYEPAFFAIFEGESLAVDYARPAFLFSMNYYVDNFEVFLSYSDLVGKVSGRYVNEVPLGVYTGRPQDYLILVPIDQTLTSDHYVSRVFKIGMSYGIGAFEHMLTWLLLVDDPEQTYLGDTAFGERFMSNGWTYQLRYLATPRTIVYGGYTGYKGTFGNKEIDQSFKTAPDYVDEGEGVFFGIRYQATDYLHFIAESHAYKGTVFLNGEYQDPVTAQEYWMLNSVTANFVF